MNLTNLTNGQATALTTTNGAALNGVVQMGQVSDCVSYGWPYNDSSWYPRPWVQDVYYPVYINHPSVPVSCSGEVHVFGCEHATKCKCGKASRKPEPKKCGACGK